MRVFQFTEQPYPDVWNDHNGSLRVNLPNNVLDPKVAGDLFHRREIPQPVHCRQHHVVRGGRPQTLGQDVSDPRALQNGANRPAGDDAGTRSGRLHEHAPRTVLTDDLVRNGPARHRDGDQAPAEVRRALRLQSPSSRNLAASDL